jgi:hypothetical protein
MLVNLEYKVQFDIYYVFIIIRIDIICRYYLSLTLININTSTNSI